MGVIAVIEVDKYNNWMVNEYNGKFSVVDCWQNNEDEWIPSFCTIQRRGKDPLKIPKGLGGQFEDLKELRAMLLTLIKKIDEYDVNGEADVPTNLPDDDIPF